MAIMVECTCHRKQGAKNKLCCECGTDLDKLKKNRKVKYWISYRIPHAGGKQRRECVGTSVEEARDALGKRQVQKREHRIFDMLPEARMTFRDLSGWYFELAAVKALRSPWRQIQCMKAFNEVLGNRTVESIKPTDIENYIAKRAEQGRAPATIQMELVIAKAIINKAFLNDMVSGRTLKSFKVVKSPQRRGENARTRTVTLDEYRRLLLFAPANLKTIIEIAMRTGMRCGEIVKLKWANVDIKGGYIRLTAEQTKEKRSKVVPIDHRVVEILNAQPRALHHDRVFTYKGNPIISVGISQSMERACKKAGVPYGRKTPEGMCLHDIRATVKTFMAKIGIEKSIRDTILGHSLQGMDCYYLRFTERDLAEAMTRYSRWLDDQLASGDQSGDQLTYTK